MLPFFKRFFTLLVLLSLFGQAIAGGVMSCQMDMNDSKLTSISLHSHCAQAITDLAGQDEKHDSEHDAKQKNNSKIDCNQECDCCLGACSSSVFTPENALTISPSSLVRIGYKNQLLINRSESLYRPPIAC